MISFDISHFHWHRCWLRLNLIHSERIITAGDTLRSENSYLNGGIDITEVHSCTCRKIVAHTKFYLPLVKFLSSSVSRLSCWQQTAVSNFTILTPFKNRLRPACQVALGFRVVGGGVLLLLFSSLSDILTGNSETPRMPAVKRNYHNKI